MYQQTDKLQKYAMDLGILGRNTSQAAIVDCFVVVVV